MSETCFSFFFLLKCNKSFFLFWKNKNHDLNSLGQKMVIEIFPQIVQPVQVCTGKMLHDSAQQSTRECPAHPQNLRVSIIIFNFHIIYTDNLHSLKSLGWLGWSRGECRPTFRRFRHRKHVSTEGMFSCLSLLVRHSAHPHPRAPLHRPLTQQQMRVDVK